ncbi:Ada metal-binding domain-containing protein [Chitinophaga nivalis]|uniref:Metal-binding protein n=2 Tax=Chitinophaga nivalis TaxID=2991709 RepID=A0ABT3IGW6_9BACT|nr:Ada metal-binding domain-containing protein [Chitinophaga nivalis]MCW3467118.1 metal-binding protein [Chitinophaga nivalis]MCW3483191.1 metal-binding protein [Chitinophaga nivalis]
MIRHITLGRTDWQRSRRIQEAIVSGQISLGGNRPLKIYGLLSCNSGKRMKMENRVFFRDQQEALSAGYRPCGHCMRDAYRLWKQGRCEDD